MKKAVILTLMYAILFSMAVGSFSLYTTSVSIPSTVIGTKVFDVSQTPAYSVVDSQNLVSNPSWMFMAFNSNTANTYNTNISIALNTAASGLRVSVFTETDLTNALAYSDFTTSQTASMVISRQFLIDVSSPISMTLKYTFEGSPLSSTNKPSGLVSALQATVTVGGTINNIRTDAEIIAGIMKNPFCAMYIFPVNKNKAAANTYLGKPVNLTSDYAIGVTGKINVNVTLANGVYTLNTQYISPNSQIQTQTLTSYNPPTAVVLNFENFSSSNTIIISNMTWNGISVPSSPVIGDATKQILIKKPAASIDGSFDVSFEFLLEGSFQGNPEYMFSSYFGYE